MIDKEILIVTNIDSTNTWKIDKNEFTCSRSNTLPAGVCYIVDIHSTQL